jgi:EAL domain-containing protein (putative c-di-GMP-specific phosphodiesterase class I)
VRSIGEALDHFKVGDFDLVLLGGSIPVEQQERLTFLIRACGSHTPVVCIANPMGDRRPFADAIFRGDKAELVAGIGEIVAQKAKAGLPRIVGRDEPSSSVGDHIRSVEEDATKLERNTSHNRHHGLSPSYREDWTADRQTIDLDLWHALERNELTLHYQPKIDLKTGTIVGAEALSRWTHPTLGPVPPAQFIPLAEKSGLILLIGSWVLREACKQARSWADAGAPLRTVAVNIAEAQLHSAGFLEELLLNLQTCGLDPDMLELDIAYAALMNQHELTIRALRSCRDMGVRISADDVSTDHSSLQGFRDLPIDAIKIDGVCVRGTRNDSEHSAKVASMIRRGQLLNLRVIAEGVETIEHLEYLWDQSCDEAQGYYFGELMPSEQLPATCTSIL